jgi:tRNA dimethylallyltransferase
LTPRPLDPSNPFCVALVGPTGAGKTALALELAGELGAEIVNLDSRQVYRGLDIGSAKPSASERARVPHHLFDVVAPDTSFDCARYREFALAAIDSIRRRGRSVLLVGGTGLYLRVLRHGLCPAPPRDAALRAELEAAEFVAPGTLHRRLQEVDRDSANRLHPHDRVRLIRALEVWELSGRPLSRWQREHGFARTEIEVPAIGLSLERSALYGRIDARCRAMIEGGLIDEVRDLWARGYGPELPALRSIGYRQVGAYLQRRCDLATALDDMARQTRHLAKRQLTWFRGDPSVRWHEAERVDVGALAAEVRERSIAFA